ncbi:type II toxin-antitoxin system RelE/ParE family toxin [Xenorhabdus sp. Sc-CR9]|uniref:type II toxin-antitoxin system RelE/ParE family toxin n=1 Tax=Xenorhabdus sp. Sc-CR9 TaxID=2584468 RepID=UPI001F1FC75A|nr:type II toxin-antitoxin system RelE/ParE family toxin [Xenorhabdus sp. Sc-CR9]
MPSIIWLRSALHDVERIHRFWKQRDTAIASRAVSVIRQGVKLLLKHPQSGRPAEGFESEYCELLIDFGDSGFMILYRYDGKQVSIINVKHQRELGY